MAPLLQWLRSHLRRGEAIRGTANMHGVQREAGGEAGSDPPWLVPGSSAILPSAKDFYRAVRVYT
jgi:hypothetical protein